MAAGWRTAFQTVGVSLLIWFGVGMAHASVDIVFGKVTSVADGDTVTVVAEDGQRIRVRLLAIDAP